MPQAGLRLPSRGEEATLFLVFVPHTLRTKSRSGIQRVATSLAQALAHRADAELVTWDEVDGQMRFCDERELFLFRDGRPAPLRLPNRHARTVGRRFQDLVPQDRAICMVLPEIGYLLPDGEAITQRVITQCLASGWRTAAVFYDLIPIQNPDYGEMRVEHERYVAQLLRCDAILPISLHVEKVLRRYLSATFGVGSAELAQAGTHIATVVLPDAPVLPSAPSGDASERDRILLLGTVEPRKQQLRVIAAWRRLREAGEMPLELQIIGSLHPKVQAAFHALTDGVDGIRYGGYLSDDAIEDAFRHARFSVFASNDEGFGLPISESLSRGVPCLTADFGAMAEVARRGGCLMLDVNDQPALLEGLRRMTAEHGLIARLQGEIGLRGHRDWGDYAAEFVAAAAPPRPSRLEAEAAACLAARRGAAAGQFGAGSPAVEFLSEADPAGGATATPTLPPPLRVAAGGVADAGRVVGADVLILQSPSELDALVETARSHPELGALPGWIDTSGDAAQAATLLAGAIALRQRQAIVARREANLAAAQDRLGHLAKRRVLSVVISTYNRALFVEANAAWIAGQIGELWPAVELVVVDNASKDDSVARLAPLLQTPGVRLVVNPTNVGMLGNLKVCSSLMLADHVWIIGDDDFMVPGTLRRLLRLLSVHPALPMAMLNFGVYHRARMSPGEHPAMYIGERILLAPNSVPSGFMRVIDAGSQHDNLFTAIYPIVFRADIAAAVFNDFFRGAPFRSLTESVPTTKFILETYALTQCYWMAEVGIVGNAHNSWQRYRVAWHAVLMPLVLRLARRSGMDGRLLLGWAAVHIGLFEEAATLFPTENIAAEFSDDDLQASYTVLQRRLPLGAANLASAAE